MRELDSIERDLITATASGGPSAGMAHDRLIRDIPVLMDKIRELRRSVARKDRMEALQDKLIDIREKLVDDYRTEVARLEKELRDLRGSNGT